MSLPGAPGSGYRSYDESREERDVYKNAMLMADEYIRVVLQDAKRNYEKLREDLDSAVGQHRLRVLGLLTKLQTEVKLSIAHPTLSDPLWFVLEHQAVNAYQARTEQELGLIELALERVGGVLEQYRHMIRRRVYARKAAMYVSLGALVGLVLLFIWALQPNGPQMDTLIPIIQLPLPILVWSAIGSFTAILYRFNKLGDVELQDPLRWLFTRPLTGIVMGTVAYYALKIGLLSIVPEDAEVLGTAEVLWLVAFIAGFSDRFADRILRALVGRFGGDEGADLVTQVTAAGSMTMAALESQAEALRATVPKQEEEPEEPTEPAPTPPGPDPAAQPTGEGAAAGERVEGTD